MNQSTSPVPNDPEALCELRKHDTPPEKIHFTWFVPKCPICDGKHTHGAGTDAADVAGYLGHRVAHCSGTKGLEKAPGGYYLVQKKGKP